MNTTRTGIYTAVSAFAGVLGRRPADLPRSAHGKDISVIQRGNLKIACFHRKGQPAVHGDEDWIFTGRPFVDDRLLEAQGATRSLEALDGKFALARLAPDRVELSTDAIGAGAAYYAEANESFYFASHLGLLLEALPSVPALNEFGLAAQLFARAQLDDETHFSGIFRVPDGATLTAELPPHARSVRLRKDLGRGILALLEEDAPAFRPDTVAALLDGGVARERFTAESLLMLSGGRDSLAIALTNAKAPTRAATYGERYSMDFIAGSRRARQLGLAFFAVPYEEWSLESYNEEIIGLHAGCAGLQTAQNIVAFDWARDHADLAAVGFLGDALTGAHLGSSAEPDAGRAMKVLLPNASDALLSEVFPEEKATTTAVVLNRFRSLSREIGARRALMVLDLKWRQARWISMMFDLCDWFTPVAYPFFQRALIASSLQADGNALKKQSVYDQMLRHALSERGLRPVLGRTATLRFQSLLRALPRGRRPVGRVDWASVLQRTTRVPQHYLCGHEVLDSLTTRSLRHAGKAARFPVGCASAAIGAAVSRFGADPRG